MFATLPSQNALYSPSVAVRLQSFYVVLHGASRHFGGPEEGGWYYDMHWCEEVHRVHGVRAALRACRALQREWELPRGLRDTARRGSVLAPTDYFVGLYDSFETIPEDSEAPGPWE